jgi:hypothetical protein
LVYWVIRETTAKNLAGIWAVVFLAFGRNLGWVLKGLLGGGWEPTYPVAGVQVLTGYTLVWGWYTLPGLLPVLGSWYFLIRYLGQGVAKKDLLLSLGIGAVGPFFHPVYFLGFLTGRLLWVILRILTGCFQFRLLLWFLTPLPFLFLFYLPFRPEIPLGRLLIIHQNPASILQQAWFYLTSHGAAIPFAVLASLTSSAARGWFLPFFLPTLFLSLAGQGGINEMHLWVQEGLYLSLLAGIGAGQLDKISRPARLCILGLTLAVIVPPLVHEIPKIKSGWREIVPEQRAAADFIRRHTPARSVLACLPDQVYCTEVVEGLGERAVVLGLLWHLDRYESPGSLKQWEREIRNIFLVPDDRNRKKICRAYGVDYIFLGPDERKWMNHQQVDIERFKQGLRLVYKNPQIEVLALNP